MDNLHLCALTFPQWSQFCRRARAVALQRHKSAASNAKQDPISRDAPFSKSDLVTLAAACRASNKQEFDNLSAYGKKIALSTLAAEEVMWTTSRDGKFCVDSESNSTMRARFGEFGHLWLLELDGHGMLRQRDPAVSQKQWCEEESQVVETSGRDRQPKHNQLPVRPQLPAKSGNGEPGVEPRSDPTPGSTVNNTCSRQNGTEAASSTQCGDGSSSKPSDPVVDAASSSLRSQGCQAQLGDIAKANPCSTDRASPIIGEQHPGGLPCRNASTSGAVTSATPGSHHPGLHGGTSEATSKLCSCTGNKADTTGPSDERRQDNSNEDVHARANVVCRPERDAASTGYIRIVDPPIVGDYENLTVEERLHNAHRDTVLAYANLAQLESSRNPKSPRYVQRAWWIDLCTRWARVCCPGSLAQGRAKSIEDADVLHYTLEEFVRELEAGTVFDRPCVIKEIFTDEAMHSVANYASLLRDCHKGKTLDIAQLKDTSTQSTEINRFVDILERESLSSAHRRTIVGGNALNLRSHGEHRPVFTFTPRLRLLEALVERDRPTVGKEWESRPTATQGCLTFSTLGLPKAFSPPHLDLFSGTWIRILDGSKLWMIMQNIKDNMDTFFRIGADMDPNGQQLLVYLTRGDVLFMPPAVPVVHAVHSTEKRRSLAYWAREQVLEAWKMVRFGCKVYPSMLSGRQKWVRSRCLIAFVPKSLLADDFHQQRHHPENRQCLGRNADICIAVA